MLHFGVERAINYVVNKPFKEEILIKLFGLINDAKTAVHSQPVDQEMEKIKQEYIQTISEKVRSVDSAIKNLEANWNKDELETLKGIVHKIAGGAGSYGFNEVSTLCKKTQDELIKKIESFEEGKLPEHLHDYLLEFYNSLRAAFQVKDPRPKEPFPREKHFAPAQVIPKAEEKKPEYIKDSLLDLAFIYPDEEFNRVLQKEASLRNFKCYFEKDPEAAKAKIDSKSISTRLLVVGDEFPQKGISGFDLINAYREKINNNSIKGLISSNTDLSFRMNSLKAGILHFFENPVSVEAILDLAEATRLQSTLTSYRILVLDDDPEACKLIEDFLKEIDAEVKSLTDPTKLLDTVREFSSELLFLDLRLPNIDGMEILRSLRADPKYQSLPIAIITSVDDQETVKRRCCVNSL